MRVADDGVTIGAGQTLFDQRTKSEKEKSNTTTAFPRVELTMLVRSALYRCTVTGRVSAGRTHTVRSHLSTSNREFTLSLLAV